MSQKPLQASPGEFWSAALFNKQLWSLKDLHRPISLLIFYFLPYFFDFKGKESLPPVALGVAGFMVIFGALCMSVKSATRDGTSKVAEDMRTINMDECVQEQFRTTLTFMILVIHFIAVRLG